MNLTSPSQVKAWCIENGFHPNRVLGQNFLIDRNALEAIVDAGLAGVSKDSGAAILEIGPGLGVLTEEILKRGCSVTAVEKDPVLAARLAGSLGNPPNLSVVEADALDWISHSPFPIPHSPFPIRRNGIESSLSGGNAHPARARAAARHSVYDGARAD